MSQIRREPKEATGYYECNHLLNIPLCIIKDSLNAALTIASGTAKGEPIIEYLMQQRMYDISERRQNEKHEKLRQECEDFENNVGGEENYFCV